MSFRSRAKAHPMSLVDAKRKLRCVEVCIAIVAHMLIKDQDGKYGEMASHVFVAKQKLLIKAEGTGDELKLD